MLAASSTKAQARSSDQLLVSTPRAALVRPPTGPQPWSTCLGQVAPPVPRHAAATSAHEVVTTAEISGFRAKINRGPRHRRRQKGAHMASSKPIHQNPS